MRHGIFYGTVENGIIKLDNSQLFSIWLKGFEGKRIEVEIQPEGDDITLSQYRYLYACVYSPLAEELGYTTDEIDGVLKREFLTLNKGTKKEYTKDKSSLNRAELATYIDNCIRKAAELGVVCLPPNKFNKEWV